MTDEQERDLYIRELHWRLLHSYVVDAVLNQPEEDMRRALQLAIGGMRLSDFGRAVDKGERVRVRPLRDDDGSIRFRVEIFGDDEHWHGLCRPPAELLGFFAEEAEAELALWFTRHPDGLGVEPGA